MGNELDRSFEHLPLDKPVRDVTLYLTHNNDNEKNHCQMCMKFKFGYNQNSESNQNQTQIYKRSIDCYV